MCAYNSKNSNKGLTFLEIVFALTLFAVALLGFLQIFDTALNSSFRATQEIIATSLAQALMAEIMSRHFEEPGAPGSFAREEGDNRYEFDDVDDYHLWSESPPITMGIPPTGGLPMDGGGVPPRPNYSDFSRNVAVEYYTVPELGEYDCKQVTVTVNGSYVRDISIVELKTKIP